ncbi:MAG: cytochrome c3 family protein [Coriobacteriales bacterium]|jgi:flagellar basal body-associated protein FliL|nr:cytochrome c3 family protein [Coriobacteriales bacterium]
MADDNEIKDLVVDAPGGAVHTGEPGGSAGTDNPEVKVKKKGKGLKIVIAIVVVLVVLAGGGGAAYALFHDDPAFCNFVCHTPMDPYVTSYDEGLSVRDYQATAQGEDTSLKLSVTAHKESEQAVNCLMCHEPTMDEQISEGIKWVTGDYELPLTGFKITTSEKNADAPKTKMAQEFCLRAECHEGITSIEELKASTASLTRNPHNSHLGAQDCNTCHKVHELSVLYCTQCHADAKVPEGWLTYTEWQKLEKAAATPAG